MSELRQIFISHPISKVSRVVKIVGKVKKKCRVLTMLERSISLLVSSYEEQKKNVN